MKAQAIRELNERLQEQILKAQTPAEHDAGFQSLHLSVMTEIAAQLAEANEHLERFNTEDNIGSIAVDVEKLTRPRWVWFKHNTFRYVVDAREVASISVPDQNHCVIIMRNEGGSDPGRWCEGGYEEVCSKLGIPTEEGK